MTPKKILICVLTTHERNGWVCKQLSEWLTDLPFMMGDRYQYSVVYAHNFAPAASARNHFCRKAKHCDPRPDWLMMIDNDMAPPKNLLDTLEGCPEDASIVVPQFQMWDESKPSVTLCWGMDESLAPKTGKDQRITINNDGWYPLTKCGTGAIFIKPEVFDHIKMPYFWYTYNEEQGLEGTEDINFCKKVLAAGLKIYGNPRVRVGHYHNVNLDVLASYIQLEKDRLDRDIKELENKPQQAGERPSVEPVAVAASPAS